MYEEQKSLAEEITKFRFSDKPDEAIALCHEAMQRFPDNSFFPKLEGDICRQYERFVQAAQAYLKMLLLLRPNQFSIFASAYRNLARNAPDEVIDFFLENIRNLLDSKVLPEELEKRLYTLLGNQLVADNEEFLFFASQAGDDKNFQLVKNKIDSLETEQDIARIKALAVFKLKSNEQIKSRRIDALLIQKLEKLKLYDLALAMIEKTQKPYRNKLILAAMLRICRKKEDYSFAEKELHINDDFIEQSSFNIQYELVYYFQIKDKEEELEKTLRLMRINSATSSIPIARTLYNFYLNLNRFDDAQNIYSHIQHLEQSRKSDLEQRYKKRFIIVSSSEEQTESEQAVWQRMKELVSDQEHNRQMIALRDLLKGFSHELGQPITNIRYAVQHYQKKLQKNLDTPEALQDLLSDILLQTNRIGMLLSRFSPIVSPKNVSEKFSVRSCVEKVLADLETRLQIQNITCQVSGPFNCTLSGDQVQFSQVFYNLVLNAMQAIDKDGHINVSISVSKDNILTIIFADDGPGIPEENFQKVFEPFFSTKDPTSGNGGEGLGLYIVWNILKMFGGTIRLDKNNHLGTKFLIQIQQKKEEHKNESGANY